MTVTTDQEMCTPEGVPWVLAEGPGSAPLTVAEHDWVGGAVGVGLDLIASRLPIYNRQLPSVRVLVTPDVLLEEDKWRSDRGQASRINTMEGGDLRGMVLRDPRGTGTTVLLSRDVVANSNTDESHSQHTVLHEMGHVLSQEVLPIIPFPYGTIGTYMEAIGLGTIDEYWADGFSIDACSNRALSTQAGGYLSVTDELGPLIASTENGHVAAVLGAVEAYIQGALLPGSNRTELRDVFLRTITPELGTLMHLKALAPHRKKASDPAAMQVRQLLLPFTQRLNSVIIAHDRLPALHDLNAACNAASQAARGGLTEVFATLDAKIVHVHQVRAGTAPLDPGGWFFP